jgi:hypothetical protein
LLIRIIGLPGLWIYDGRHGGSASRAAIKATIEIDKVVQLTERI